MEWGAVAGKVRGSKEQEANETLASSVTPEQLSVDRGQGSSNSSYFAASLYQAKQQLQQSHH